jgi:hypothetical protein
MKWKTQIQKTKTKKNKKRRKLKYSCHYYMLHHTLTFEKVW